jgi:ribosomal protein RSM22 (predicted rRNA methylase)
VSSLFPAPLRAAIAGIAAEVPGAELARRAAAISAAYRAGRSSRVAVASHADVAAYLVTRMPATFAASSAALSAARELLPSFAPSSLLDLCAGPGTAGFAAHALWPRLTEFTLVDASGAFLEGARRLNVAVGMTALGGPKMVLAPLRSALDQLASADIVAMSYALVELPEGEIAALARGMWKLARALLVFVEPGTPEGFRRILLAREALIAAGANIIAPCPHRAPCPMQGPAWCHFSERLPRLRDHLRAKAARLPYEDEPYTYLALGRMRAEWTPSARLVSRLRLTKAEASCRVCAADGALMDVATPRRDRQAYARLRRLDWGDALLGDGDWRRAAVIIPTG